jgi:hypothetical protein
MGRKRSDSNQTKIVAELRKIGATVQFLTNVGSGVPDLLVGYNGINYLLEIKNLTTTYGKKGLNEKQIKWHTNWSGQVAVISSLDEALATLNYSNDTTKENK